jgi:hypothetical protein
MTFAPLAGWLRIIDRLRWIAVAPSRSVGTAQTRRVHRTGSIGGTPMPVEMTIKFEWNALARVGLDPQGKLAFPRAPSRPGLYRFEFDGAKGRQEYIGQTDTLGRRFQHYRTPGSRRARIFD